MRKFLFTTLFAILALGMYAQKIDDIKDLIGKQQYDKAKEQVDKYLANEKNAKKADGWFYKGVIYNELAKNDKYASLLNGVDGRQVAFEAFKQYIELDPKNLLGTLEQNARLFDIYNGYFDAAATGYNAKKYDVAFTNFKKAYEVEQYISGKDFTYGNFSFPKLDTSLIQNIALAAMMDKKEDSAIIYYQKLADAKITGPNFLNIYQFLVQHFQEKGDKANMEKYLALGRELYPESEYWCAVQLKEAGDDKEKLLAKYEELTGNGCGTYSMYYNYAAEMFNYLFTQDKKPADYQAKQAQLKSILDKTIAINPTPEANLLAARSVYNGIYDLQDSIDLVKGTKPADIKKKNDFRTQITAKFEEMLPYAQAAYDNFDKRSESLKPVEKGNFRVAADLLVRYWQNKKDSDKAKMYQDKMKSME